MSDIVLADEEETRALGARLASLLRRGDVVALSGPLGAGKTTLARGLIAAAAGEDDAPSPTFPLVLVYDADGLALWHFDLYRLERAEDAYELGVESAFLDGASLVEWPEKLGPLLPKAALTIRLEPVGAARRVVFEGDAAWIRRLAEAGIVRRP
ncbi:MAG: tRNA (adenosine(37)-N6)-threonylcarbamoyltransferase complex ATPase subunit type 1 TsaE [Parvularculaceae bacterium]|nr:tRNA (adenosine(37)-N6)-threonylcarbamoyltransferase complex ATPase subunit type 1 TsaE [Parvularculaceae bacterium]